MFCHTGDFCINMWILCGILLVSHGLIRVLHHKDPLDKPNFPERIYISRKHTNDFYPMLKEIHTSSNEDSTTALCLPICQFNLPAFLLMSWKSLGSLMSPWTNIAMFTPIFLRQKVSTPVKLLVLSHIWNGSDFSRIIRSHLSSLKIRTAARSLPSWHRVAEFFPRKCSRMFFWKLNSYHPQTELRSSVLKDKAGIAESASTALERILHGKFPSRPSCHRLSLQTRREIGSDRQYFDVRGKVFGADYTLYPGWGHWRWDQVENFNACSCKSCFSGCKRSSRSPQNTMVNASLVAMEFNSMLPVRWLQSHGTQKTMRDFSICVLWREMFSARLHYVSATMRHLLKQRQNTLTLYVKILNGVKSTVALTPSSLVPQYEGDRRYLPVQSPLLRSSPGLGVTPDPSHPRRYRRSPVKAS